MPTALHMPRLIFILPLLLAAAPLPAQEPALRVETNVPIEALTQGPVAHWFGYYDKFQFDPTDRYVLSMEVGFEGRTPTPEDTLTLGYIDREKDNAWTPFAETRAWSWQQGAMLQWLPGSASKVIYNDREGTNFISVIQDVFTGEKTVLPRAIYTVSADGSKGLSINFARIDDTRPGYGYKGGIDPYAADLIPSEDGIFLVDLNTGDSRQILDFPTIAKTPFPGETAGKHWLNHLLFNPDGTRFIFLHRARVTTEAKSTWETKMFTANPDGSDLHVVANYHMVSHFIWRDPGHILAWARDETEGNHFYLYKDQSAAKEVIGGDLLDRDGHCTYSPDRKWILSDTYPDKERLQTLFLFNPGTGERHDLGRFYLKRPTEAEFRCDLHPRWSRDGRFICIDSMHAADQRQMYLLDVSEYTQTP